MKTLISILSIIFTTTAISYAQDDCIPFLPKDEGTVLVNKSYNSENKLISVLSFKVNKVYTYQSGETMEVGVVLANDKDSVIDQGLIEASCVNDVFYMKMTNKALSPKLIELLGNNTTLIESFMGPPDDSNSSIDGFPMSSDESATLSIESTKHDEELIAVKIVNREYQKDELISTPAGIFDAVKVTFDYEVTRSGQTAYYKGAEWYAIDAGIVRSETYDHNHKIKTYTLLTALNKE